MYTTSTGDNAETRQTEQRWSFARRGVPLPAHQKPVLVLHERFWHADESTV